MNNSNSSPDGAMAQTWWNGISRYISTEKIWLYPAEKTMLVVSLAAATIDLALIMINQSRVDWVGYLTILTLIAGLMTMGFAYRISQRSERIGAAAICAGLFIFFSLCLSMFNYQLLPLWRPTIDLQLNAVDQMFGYHWPTLIAWAAEHPVFSSIVRFAYMSTIPQFAAIVIILGMSGRIRDLHVLIVSLTLTATFTICFWGVFPSFGAESLYDLPWALEGLVAPEVGTRYGDQLLYMAQNGPGMISPKEIKGVIGFPSYHMVLAVTAVYAARNVKWVFAIYLALNALILPGIYIHGGHHLVDLPAGLLVSAVGIYLARRAVYRDYREHKLATQLAS